MLFRSRVLELVLQVQRPPLVGPHLVEGQDLDPADHRAPALDDAGDFLTLVGSSVRPGTRTKRTHVSMPRVASRSPKAMVGARERPLTLL